ncbi:MAG: copper homeostasis protein CutC [Pseudoxanthomonas sp.]
MSGFTLEIAANSLASALAAQQGGADRVELCENLGEGGCTPSHGTLAATRDRLRIPLYVLIRPRTGDFVYGEWEREVMLRDIEHCVRLGCDGVVIGALDANGDVDAALCRQLIGMAGMLGVTFHRAFDVARDPLHALEAIAALGCERVLTSGAAADAPSGAMNLSACVQAAGSRLSIMAGAGVAATDIATLKAAGVREFHASAKAVRQGALQRDLPGLSADWLQSDAETVRRLKQAIMA